jgi:hypothetical protein
VCDSLSQGYEHQTIGFPLLQFLLSKRTYQWKNNQQPIQIIDQINTPEKLNIAWTESCGMLQTVALIVQVFMKCQIAIFNINKSIYSQKNIQLCLI